MDEYIIKGGIGSPTSSTPLDLYTCPSDTTSLLIEFRVANNSGTSRTVYAYVVNSTNTIQYVLIPYNTSISSYSGFSDNGKHVLTAGMKVRVITSDGIASEILCESTVIEGI